MTSTTPTLLTTAAMTTMMTIDDSNAALASNMANATTTFACKRDRVVQRQFSCAAANTESSNDGRISAGIIVVIVVGTLCVLSVLVTGVVLLFMHRKVTLMNVVTSAAATHIKGNQTYGQTTLVCVWRV